MLRSASRRAVEFDRHAAASYRNNLIKSGRTQTLLYEEDIELLDPATVRAAAGFEKAGCDILMGGPPCQGFFRASNQRCRRGRSTQRPFCSAILSSCGYSGPCSFLWRMCRAFFGRATRASWTRSINLADAADYEVMEPVLLNAKDFGVPQSRRRAFILGMDRRRRAAMPAWPPTATHIGEASEGRYAPNMGECLRRIRTASAGARQQ